MSIRIKQHDETDCGVACLASVAAHYRLFLSLAQIRQYAGTTKNGTSLLGLAEAAKHLGFDACGVEASLNGLLTLPLPAIAHIKKKDGALHYMVIYALSRRRIQIMDPAFGTLRRQKLDDFQTEWTGNLLLLIPGIRFKPESKMTSPITYLWQLLLPHRYVLIQILFGALIYTLLGLSGAIFVQKITDYVIPDGHTGLLNLMTVIMLILLAFQMFINTIRLFYSLITGQKIDAILISSYYQHLLQLPLAFYESMQTGELISRVNDAFKIRSFINDLIPNLVANSFILLFSTALMISYSWKMTLLLSYFLPLYFFLFFFYKRFSYRNQRQVIESVSHFESHFIETVTSIKTMKYLNLETFMSNKLDEHLLNLLKAMYRSGRVHILSKTTSDTINQLLIIALLWLGAKYVLAGEITPGQFFSFYALTSYFIGPITSIIIANGVIQDALIATDRLSDITTLEGEIQTKLLDFPSPLKTGIRFDKVCFKHGSFPVLFDTLSLHIPAGKLTAITGQSGSGKSTLFALLQNLYPIYQGTIFIDDYPVNHIAIASLRKSIGLVPQYVDIFSGNLLENIAPGEPAPDMKRVYTVCIQAGIWEFIKSLPEGLLTPVGEKGARLSGGQRQRIGFARALYPDPELFLFDEINSALDILAEQEIQNTIRWLLTQKKTIVLIAHRLSLLRLADHIIVMENGAVMEQGTHETLLLARKYYYHLWNVHHSKK